MRIEDIEAVNRAVTELKQLDRALEAINSEQPMITCGKTMIVIRKAALDVISNMVREDLLIMRKKILDRLQVLGVSQ